MKDILQTLGAGGRGVLMHSSVCFLCLFFFPVLKTSEA